jgi:hypothetical protein
VQVTVPSVLQVVMSTLLAILSVRSVNLVVSLI